MESLASATAWRNGNSGGPKLNAWGRGAHQRQALKIALYLFFILTVHIYNLCVTIMGIRDDKSDDYSIVPGFY